MMKKNSNQNINSLFNEMDNSKKRRADMYYEMLALTPKIDKQRDNIYQAIYNVLPGSSKDAITAKQVVGKLTDDPDIAKRLLGMLTGTAHYDSQFPDSSYSHIMRQKKIFRSYSIECDENGTPIPGAFVITHEREKNVYWYK